MFKHIRLLVGIIILIVSATVLLWSVIPVKKVSVSQVLQPESMSLKINSRQEMFAIPVPYQVMLEWPGGLRIGDVGVVSLQLLPVQGKIAISTRSPGNFDVYEVANVMAEARLEVAGVVLEPANPTRVSLTPGDSVRFLWEVHPSKVGSYTGNTWLSLRFLPLDGSPIIQVPIYVGEINLHPTSLLGLSAQGTRLLGGMGIVIGLALIVDDMIKYNIQARKKAPGSDLVNSKGIS